MQLANSRLIQVRLHNWRDDDLELRPQAARWLLDHEVASVYSHAFRRRFRPFQRPDQLFIRAVFRSRSVFACANRTPD